MIDIDVKPEARQKILGLIESQSEPDLALRLAIARRQNGLFQYDFGLIGKEHLEPGDLMIDGGGFDILVDRDSARSLAGSSIDWYEDAAQQGFKIENPNPLWPDELSMRIQVVLDEQVNPAIAAHGGWVALKRVDEAAGIAYVEMGGGCQGCGMARVTLRLGIARQIQEAIPEVGEVVDITEHEAGENPYYASDMAGETPFPGGEGP